MFSSSDMVFRPEALKPLAAVLGIRLLLQRVGHMRPVGRTQQPVLGVVRGLHRRGDIALQGVEAWRAGTREVARPR